MDSDQFPALYSGSWSFSQPPAQKRPLTEELLSVEAKRQRRPTQPFDPMTVYGPEHMAEAAAEESESVPDPHDGQEWPYDSYNSQESESSEDDYEDEEEDNEEDEDSPADEWRKPLIRREEAV
jgi:hypothetical protein